MGNFCDRKSDTEVGDCVGRDRKGQSPEGGFMGPKSKALEGMGIQAEILEAESP